MNSRSCICRTGVKVRARLLSQAALIAVAVSVVFGATAVRAAVTVSEGLWNGKVSKQAPCVVLENPKLKVTILKKGAYIVSVQDKKTGEEFINRGTAPKSEKHGIYDRVDVTGRHVSNIAGPNHIVNQEYAMTRQGEGTLIFKCETKKLRIVRTVKLDSDKPRMRIDVAYTNMSPEKTRNKIFLLSQFNVNRAPASYNQVVAMPGEKTVERLLTNNQGFYGPSIKSGWWLVADRDSKKSVVLTHPTDGTVESIYLYRTSAWFHLLPFSPSTVLNNGDSISLWQEYLFLPGVKDAQALSPDDVSVKPAEFARLKKVLLEELAKDARKPGQPMAIALPEIEENSRIEPSPAGKPLARIAYVSCGIYDHPTKLHARLWTSIDHALEALAEVKEHKPDLLIMHGVSANGLENEFDSARKAARLTGVPVAFLPGRVGDRNNIAGFEKVLGPARWVRKVKDVTFIADSEPLDQSKWFKEQLDKAKGGRVVVIGPSTRPTRFEKQVNLALLWINTSGPSFQRMHNWPVLYTQTVDRGYYAVINVFPEFLEVCVKQMGQSFGPRMYLDKNGKSPSLGVPSFVKGKPILKVAHIADTQLALPSRQKAPGGEPQDQTNMKNALSEINKLGVDFALNAGDLVNRGSLAEQWKVYLDIRKAVKVPFYELLGNHDWDRITVDGKVVTESYEKYIDDPLVYDFEKNGVLFMVAGSRVTSPSDLMARIAKAKKAKCTVLACHYPLTDFSVWPPALVDALKELGPSIVMNGHTHYLRWARTYGINEFTSSGLAWTKMGDQKWNGYFIHVFYNDQVVSSFKRLGCDDLFFTVVTPYKKK